MPRTPKKTNERERQQGQCLAFVEHLFYVKNFLVTPVTLQLVNQHHFLGNELLPVLENRSFWNQYLKVGLAKE